MAEASNIAAEFAFGFQTDTGAIDGAVADWNALPSSPSLANYAAIQRTLQENRSLNTSQEVLGHRETQQSRHGPAQTQGNWQFELALGDYDTPISWAFGRAFSGTQVTTGTSTIGATASTSTLSGTGLFGSFVAGDFVVLTGFSTAVDGAYIVTSATADALVVTPEISEDVTGDADEVVTAPRQRTTLAPTLVPGIFQRGWTDIGRYQAFLGTVAGGVNFGLSPNQNLALTMPLIGTRALPMSNTSVDASIDAAGSSTKFDVLSGAITIGNQSFGTITGLTFNYNFNNQVGPAVIGSRYPTRVFVGRSSLTGQFTALLEDETLVNYFINETEISLTAFAKSAVGGGDFHGFRMPRVKVNGAPVSDGQTGAAIVTLNFEALRDNSFGGSLGYYRSNTS